MATRAREPRGGPDGHFAAPAIAHTETVSDLDAELRRIVEGAIDDRTRRILDVRAKAGRPRRRGWLVRRLLLAADMLGLVVAFAITQAAWSFGTDLSDIGRGGEALLFLATLPLWIVLAKVHGLYGGDEERTDHTTVDDLVGVFHLVTVGSWIIFAGAWITGVAHADVTKIAQFWALAIALVTAGRGLARIIARRRLLYFQNTVIVGTGEIGRLVARKYLGHPEYGINLVGFVDGDPFQLDGDLRHLAVLGPSSRLPEIVQLLDVERVVIAFSRDSNEQTLDVISLLKDLDVQVDIVPRLFEVLGPRVDIHTVEGLPLIGLPPLHLSRSSIYLKRAIDVFGATLGLALFSPLLLMIALAVKLDSRGPVFYCGERVGRNGRRFSLFKFRTMRIEACRGSRYGADQAEEAFAALMADPEAKAEFERTHKLREDPRVTRVGRFLRSTSLDEAPQLVNVLLGHLSLVGPRPVTVEEQEMLNSRPAREGAAGSSALDGLIAPGRPHRLRGYWEIARLRPGVTGYWQITGRSGMDYRERARLDMAYVTSWSLKLDFLIVAKTLRVLVARNGAY